MDRDGITRIAERHGIRLLVQFGSSVTGKTHEWSDVDLAALLERPSVSLREYSDLLHDLEAQFPGQAVDLAILNHADPLFLKKSLEPCRLLCGEARRLQRLKIYAFKRYQDHKPYLALERRVVARRLAGLLSDG